MFPPLMELHGLRLIGRRSRIQADAPRRSRRTLPGISLQAVPPPSPQVKRPPQTLPIQPTCALPETQLPCGMTRPPGKKMRRCSKGQVLCPF